MKTTTPFLLALFLAACGGGSPSRDIGPAASPPPAPAPMPAPAPPPPENTATKLLVIGNSLTYVPIRTNLGWLHAGGMAASDAAHDFVHLTAAALGLEPDARNFRDLELYPAAPANLEQIGAYGAMADAETDVVVELGDNVSNVQPLTDFATAYGMLLDALANRQALVCATTWYHRPDVDAIILAACAAHGGKIAALGDIREMGLDTPPPRENAELHTHPHDPSMALIAARVEQALKQQHTY